MKYEPRPYQCRAREFLEATNYRALLGLRMGLGKTVISATAVADLIDTLQVRRALIVGPPRVVRHVWPAEFEKWDHLRWLRPVPLVGEPRFHRTGQINGEPVRFYRPSWAGAKGAIHLASYEQLATRRVKDRVYLGLVDLYRQNWPYDLVVFDEVHRMKTPGAKRFRAFRRVAGVTRYCIGLSGTLAANGLLDLWAPMYLIDQGARLGHTFSAFKDRWFREAPNGWGVEILPRAEEEITQRIQDVCLTMRAEDHLDLPERLDNYITVTLPQAARTKYDRLKRDLYLRLEQGEVTPANAAVLTAKCEQAANGALYLDGGGAETIHDAKLDALEDILAGGEPVLCVTQFTSDWERIRARFPFAQRIGRNIEEWNAGRVRLLVLQASQGEGLNLQAGGRTVVWFAPTWNLLHYEQTNARLHRQGQARTVIVHHLLAEDTIDQLKLLRLQTKAEVQDILMGALK